MAPDRLPVRPCPHRDWWRGAVCYQIYPRSFLDTTGTGTGDLNGITAKIDYLAGLGVKALWISPFLQSPQEDYGYDISDYRAIDPLFGTMADFESLLATAHKAGLKIIMDMVLSHTSDRHPWFMESKQDAQNPKADWYVWANPKPDGSPPNNWISVFGGSAWQYHPGRGQYYLHNFLKQQPDLNYHNPAVRAEMLDICRFWLDKGIDGLRLDVINFCYHDASLRDNPPRSDGGAATQLEFPDAYSMQRHIHDKSRPENLVFIEDIRALLDAYPAVFALAEIGDDEAVKTAGLYTRNEKRLHTAYSFEMMTNKGALPPPVFFREKIEAQQAQERHSWPSWAFSNHDVVRAASRWSGDDYGHDPRISRLLPALLASLRGTVFLYQGEELGLPEAEIPHDALQDPWGKYLWPKWQGRDGCRTPMPWDGAAKNAGFSAAERTWLPVAQSHGGLGVAAQERDTDSTLHAVRRFLRWRATQESLQYGNIVFLDGVPDSVLAFRRGVVEESTMCAFNLSGAAQQVRLDGALEFAGNGATYAQGVLALPAYGYAFLKPAPSP